MGESTEIAILAGGCFWPMQQLLRGRKGVISTRVGYTGGENDNPTADNHPGHAEAVEVVFDPGQTRYRDIVEFFLQAHRPDLGEDVVGFGYRSEIFCTSDEQREAARGAVADAAACRMFPGEVVTKISQAGPFWAAKVEDQDYLRDFPDAKNQFRRGTGQLPD
ncbi:MAG TPA: peptide-methionine (S)-S-oxide reductase [Streptosporangiaceae bacterium]|nr:peptide-methionine (S)-S-oxide reductase [Streptosporangiaceae bacterium]